MITAIIVAFLSFSGCEKDQQCAAQEDCGFTETCVDGTCVDKSCATSTECSMEQNCQHGKCVAGCAEDADCYPGDMCDTEKNKCIQGACRSTTLDCGYKEFCDSVTGDCYEASGYYCHACSGDGDCGGNGNLCLSLPGGAFCGVTCEYEDDCPSAFTCVPVSDAYGNIVSNQCIAYCTQFASDRSAPLHPVRVSDHPSPDKDPTWSVTETP